MYNYLVSLGSPLCYGENVSFMKNNYKMSFDDYAIESIGGALFRLLRTKDFTEIKVNELCKCAGVGRSTFYRRYTNKTTYYRVTFDYLNFLYNKYKAEYFYEFEHYHSFFYSFIESIRNEIDVLYSHGYECVFFKFIIRVFTSAANENDLNSFYLSSSIGGMWVGILDAIIRRDFSDSIEDIDASLVDIKKVLTDISDIFEN